MRIDPNDDQYQSNGASGNFDVVPDGTYFLAASDFRRGTSSQKGTPFLAYGIVVIGGKEHGKRFEQTWYLTDKSAWRFAKFLQAVGAPELETDSDDELEEFTLQREFRAHVKREAGTGGYKDRNDINYPSALTTAEREQVKKILKTQGDPLGEESAPAAPSDAPDVPEGAFVSVDEDSIPF